MNFKDWERATGRVSDTNKSPRGFVVGDRVVLPPWEDQPAERGKVISVPDQRGRINDNMIVVEVDQEYCEDEDDDGLREISDDQCEKVTTDE